MKNNVETYIAAAPKEMRAKLEELRRVIKTSALTAEEYIGYGMPYYRYKGPLVYFRLWKKHIGIYIPPPVIQEHKKDLKDYETSMATVRFPLNKPLPTALVKKLIMARMKKNDEKARNKLSKEKGNTRV